MDENRENVIVIGGGPAGMAAAIQLRRSGFDPLLIECGELGGLLWNAHWVENYPGFPSGITGPKLVRLFQEQTRNKGVRNRRTTVEKVNRADGGFRVDTSDGHLDARAVVIASGTSPKPVESALSAMCGASSIFYEVKDLPSERRRGIAILGGGDAAFDYGLGLAREGCRVEICFRSDEPRALPLLVERTRQEPLIRVHRGVSIETARNGSGILEIRLSDGARLKVDALLAAIGRDRNTRFLGPDIPPDISPGISMETPEDHVSRIPGLCFAGDVQRGLHRQTAIAVGDGVAAAMQTAAFLASPGGGGWS